jgi:hypothetical protein
MRNARALICEELERRHLRAEVGLPWRDPIHLTLSFAPDGTQIAGDSSDLFQTLDAQSPSAAAWEGVITQAFQTWVAGANISVGVVADDGAPIGVAGLMQGDPRFGDIRIGARPMSPDVYAITVAPNPSSRGSAMLVPSPYSVSISTINDAEGALPSIAYQLSGGSESDAIGISPSDPVEEPTYPSPGDPTVDC